MTELVKIIDNDVFTDSLVIAENTGVDHKAVIQLIRKNINELNQLGNITFEMRKSNGAGRPTEYALLNEPQATLLIAFMRNSDIVKKFKILLVKQFFEMRKQLESIQDPYDLMIQQCRRLQAQERRLKAVETEQDQIKKKLSEFDSETGYRTILGYCRDNNLILPRSKANSLGRKAAKLCRERGFEIGSASDERYSRVNSYPIEILAEIIPFKGTEA